MLQNYNVFLVSDNLHTREEFRRAESNFHGINKVELFNSIDEAKPKIHLEHSLVFIDYSCYDQNLIEDFIRDNQNLYNTFYFIIIEESKHPQISEFLSLTAEDIIYSDKLKSLALIISRFLRKQEYKPKVSNYDSGVAIDDALIGFFRSSVDGKILYANKALIHMLGYESLTELKKGGFADIYYSDPRQRKHFVSLFNDSDSVKGIELELRRRDGAPLYVRENCRAIKDAEQNKILFFEGTIEDITANKLTQSELAENRELYKCVVESLSEGLIITDREDKILFANSRVKELTGYSPEELCGEFSYQTFLEPSSWHYVLDKNEVRFKGISDSYNIKIYRKDGSSFWASVKAVPYKDPEGNIIGTIGAMSDISEIIEKEKALRASEENYKTVVENVREVIFQTDIEGRINFVNPSWTEITGHLWEETLNRFFIEFICPEDRPKIAKEFVSLVSGRKKFIQFDLRCGKKDGSFRWFNVNAKMYSHTRQGKGISGTLTDIHEKKGAEEALIKAKEKAEESDRIKSHFLTQISHEIRTPINNILNYNSLIKEVFQNQYNGIMAEAFQSIENGGKRLVRTIDLILNMSMVHAGNYDLSPKLLNLAKILCKLASDYSAIARTKKLKLLFSNEVKDAFVFCDEYTVSNAFQNLIENSLKYTEKGTVRITLRNISGKLTVEIEDTGIGISNEYLKRIFEPFSQEEGGYSRSYDGNGLGLALAKKYLELNNAGIEVKSEKGKGTKFIITFEHN